MRSGVAQKRGTFSMSSSFCGIIIASSSSFVLFAMMIFTRGRRRSDHDNGVDTFFTYENNENVKEAPPASLSNANAVFTDQRGSYLRFAPEGGKNDDADLYVNVVFSKRDSKRSGDVHKCWQVNYIAFGKVLLTTLKKPLVAGGTGERTIEYGKDDVIRIPPHVPHLYEFKEDTIFTEKWEHDDGSPCEFKAWLYTPFRERIDAASLVRT